MGWRRNGRIARASRNNLFSNGVLVSLLVT